MKRLIVIFIIILSPSLLSQVDTTFTELRGLDDSSGATNLFYRKHSYEDLSPYWRRHDDFYHLNLANQSDTLIFEDYFYYTFSWIGGRSARDFEFWNNNPQQFVLCGEESEIDPVATIWKYGEGVVWNDLGWMHNVEVSKQDDNLLYAVRDNGIYMGLLKSTDGGSNWFFDPNAALGYYLINLSPFNDLVFFSTKDSHLYKSTDSGVSYVLVDSSINWGDASSYLFFDQDSSHAYAIIQGSNPRYFLRSSDGGNSWNLVSSSQRKIHVSVDPSQSGTIFLSDGNEIKLSEDYGNTFNSYWQFQRPIVGLYKKPNSDILYAATPKDIYEVAPTDTVSIKHLSTIPVSIDDVDQPLVQKFELYQNYPNPFNPTTNLKFGITQFGFVTLQVYDVSGCLVRTLASENKVPGDYSVEWDGSNDQEQPVASGVYLYRLEITPTSKAGTRNVLTRKMVLIR